MNSNNSNIIGYTDRYNQPILVGQVLINNHGFKCVVQIYAGAFCVIPLGGPLWEHASLEELLYLSEWVEIVVPPAEPDKASVATLRSN